VEQSWLNSRRPFRFETFWLTHPDFHEFVRTTWQKCNPTDGTKMSIFQRKLKYLKGEIKCWNHSVFGNIFKMKDALNQEMKAVQQKMINEGRTKNLTKKE